MMKDNQIRTLVAILALFAPSVAMANMIWPSIYIVEQYYVWYVILAGLIIEIIAAHLFLKTNWKRSILIMFAANAISAILGLLLIPVSGIIVEFLTLPFGGGTFHISHWIIDYLCAVLANTVVEGLSLKWIFKYPFKSNFWWLFCANLISVIICVALLLLKV
ncbi:MAG: hypothetical protein K2J74_02825 [Muribaculaceae bacterium]|nr:hypothetical protein [Muribaculaceae bacterium]